MLLHFKVALPKKGATKTVFAQAKQNTNMQWLYYAKGIYHCTTTPWIHWRKNNID